jgi:hypothetical protein
MLGEVGFVLRKGRISSNMESLVDRNMENYTKHGYLPSGKHTKNYGKSPFLMGKSTINGHFE